MKNTNDFATQAIHIGQTPDPTTGAIIPPLYLTSTYVQETPGKHKGYEYTRSGNPNFTNAEKTLAALEKGEFAHLYNSGLGATTTVVLSLLQAGDSIVSVNDVYGGTFRLMHNVFDKFGIGFRQIDTNDEQALRKSLQDNTVKILWIESPTNPLLKVSDIKKLADIAKEHNVITVVDNTFASPYFQQPLALGADIVLHSATKYLGGHSDLISGVTITNNEQYAQAFTYHRNAAGINPNPFDAWLLSRSLKTLAVRMEKHQSNAKKIVEFLSRHPLVDHVYYPGFSGMISVEFNLSYEQVIQLISNFRYIQLAESLGGVESLVDHPASMTHGSIPKETREANGLRDGLMRFSIGIESIEDLLQDLQQGLNNISQNKGQ